MIFDWFKKKETQEEETFYATVTFIFDGNYSHRINFQHKESLDELLDNFFKCKNNSIILGKYYGINLKNLLFYFIEYRDSPNGISII